VLVPMELARLPYRGGELVDAVGERALRADGKRRWRRHVAEVVAAVAAAFVVDEVVLGGGNAVRLKELPEGARLGSNALAVAGGERLWSEPTRAHHARFAARGKARRRAGVRPSPGRATTGRRAAGARRR
jgi:polyphosphate glucokinase